MRSLLFLKVFFLLVINIFYNQNFYASEDPSIFYMIDSNDIDAINEKLNDEKYNVNSTSALFDKMTPLFYAVNKQKIEILKVLLNNKQVDPNKTVPGKNTSLHRAVALGNLEMVKLLAKRKDLDFEVVNEKGNTPLDIARQFMHNNQDTHSIFMILGQKINEQRQNNRRLNLNFFWVGNTPSYALKMNLANWKEHLLSSNSKAEVFLWTNKETLEKMFAKYKGLTLFKAKSNLFLNEDESFNINQFTWSLKSENGENVAISVLEIDALLEHYQKDYPKLIRMYQSLIANKVYPFASDYARAFILNFFPGIYFDADYKPNLQKVFFKDLNELEYLFLSNGYSTYNNFFMLSIHNIIENMTLMSFKMGVYENIFLKFENELSDSVFNEKINLDINNYIKNNNNPRVKELNKSNFTKDKDKKYLDAYLLRKEEVFVKYNKDENIYFKYPYLEWFGLSMFGYYKYKWPYFIKFCNEHLNIYFYSFQKNEMKLYSWRNPGFSRLCELNEVQKTISNRYSKN